MDKKWAFFTVMNFSKAVINWWHLFKNVFRTAEVRLGTFFVRFEKEGSFWQCLHIADNFLSTAVDFSSILKSGSLLFDFTICMLSLIAFCTEIFIDSVKKKECVQTFSQIWIVLYRCNHWKQLSCFHGYVDVMECLLLRMHDFISFFLSSNFQCDIIQWSKWFVEMRILLGFFISPLLLNITWNLPVPLNYSQSSVVFVPEKNKPSFLNSIYWK